MTYLQLVNKVLKRLRENEASSVSDTNYSKLIGELVNEAKREVEDAFDWISLRDTVQATTISGSFRYFLEDVGKRFKLRNVYDDTTNAFLTVKNSTWMTEQFNSNASSGRPQHYDFAGEHSGDYQVDLYPIPDGAYIINFNLIRPQDDLVLDTTELHVEDHPVILGAYAKAIAERGDDNGMQYQVAYRAYREALGDAIAIDAAKSPVGTLDWDAGYNYGTSYV